jgi:hypothetical protein
MAGQVARIGDNTHAYSSWPERLKKEMPLRKSTLLCDNTKMDAIEIEYDGVGCI